MELGKPLWEELSEKVPRGTHDGTMYRYVQNRTIPVAAGELRTFITQHPTFPFTEPLPPEARAHALLSKEAPDGKWTKLLMLRAKAYFEAGAAKLGCLVIFPEVFARDELRRRIAHMEFCQLDVVRG